jgi:hypothetical protein
VNEYILNQKELEASVIYWKKILRLDNFDIEVKIARRDNMDKEDSNSCMDFSARTETAYIKILDPIDYSEYEGTKDMERSLVIRLLCLKFYWIKKDDLDGIKSVLLDQTLNRISKALLEVKRSCIKEGEI